MLSLPLPILLLIPPIFPPVLPPVLPSLLSRLALLFSTVVNLPSAIPFFTLLVSVLPFVLALLPAVFVLALLSLLIALLALILLLSVLRLLVFHLFLVLQLILVLQLFLVLGAFEGIELVIRNDVLVLTGFWGSYQWAGSGRMCERLGFCVGWGGRLLVFRGAIEHLSFRLLQLGFLHKTVGYLEIRLLLFPERCSGSSASTPASHRLVASEAESSTAIPSAMLFAMFFAIHSAQFWAQLSVQLWVQLYFKPYHQLLHVFPYRL